MSGLLLHVIYRCHFCEAVFQTENWYRRTRTPEEADVECRRELVAVKKSFADHLMAAHGEVALEEDMNRDPAETVSLVQEKGPSPAAGRETTGTG
jgi:hypothetical protein